MPYHIHLLFFLPRNLTQTSLSRNTHTLAHTRGPFRLTAYRLDGGKKLEWQEEVCMTLHERLGCRQPNLTSINSSFFGNHLSKAYFGCNGNKAENIPEWGANPLQAHLWAI